MNIPGDPREDGTETGNAALESQLGHSFADPEILCTALRHRSFCAENPGLDSNERLEFLGDAVLGFVVAAELYKRWADVPEGTFSKARSMVVSGDFLAEAANDFTLGYFLYLGRGEEASGGRAKPSILADALEAVIGAVYLDGGLDAAEALVLKIVGHRLDDAVTGESHQDFKSQLQELAARRYSDVPTYTLRAYGPDHAKRFEAEVAVRGAVVGNGTGKTKKQAEQAAAEVACETILDDERDALVPEAQGRSAQERSEEADA